MPKQLKKEPVEGTHIVKWTCEGCVWDMTQPPASDVEVLTEFKQHDCDSYEIVFRRGGQ